MILFFYISRGEDMKTYLNEITGIADAIVSMYMSKWKWNREMEIEIRSLCRRVLDADGRINDNASLADISEYSSLLNKVVKWGCKHITLLRFIDISITVEGLHRAGQDDWDSHAARFNNRIVRSSTSVPLDHSTSEWYQSKIIPTDIALAHIGFERPAEITYDGKVYVKSTNGYILEEMKDDPDVRRGLYMLSIPSNFIFKINLTEYAHVFKERNTAGNANPEVKLCCESITDQIESFQPLFNRELLDKIKN